MTNQKNRKNVRKVEQFIILATICVCLIGTVSASAEDDRAAGADSVRQVMSHPPVASVSIQPSGYAAGSVEVVIGIILLIVITAVAIYAYTAKKKGRHIAS
jgi:flavin reductase (DIM6/NTAB) family NADH-FMN oxidoreductase RutF